MKAYIFGLVITVLAITVKECLTEDLKLLILHNNDMHSRFEESDKHIGGMARVAHVIREARKAAASGRGRETLYLNAGDTYTGTIWFNVHRWKIVSEFLNVLQPNVTSFGNHEFDDKIDGVVPFIKAATFPIVAANMDFSKEPAIAALNIKKSVVLEISGKKIGIIGFLTPQTAVISATEGITFTDEVTAIKEESERLYEAGVKIIIALGHSGFEMDQKIAENVPLVDLVIGGHTNTFLWNGDQPHDEEVEGDYPHIVKQPGGRIVPVVQANAYTKYMGRLNITFNDEGEVTEALGQPLLINEDIAQEEDVLTLLDKFRPEVEATEKQEVGVIRVTLDGEKESCRTGECNFCNFITDAFVAYHSSVYDGTYWTDAPIGILNAGGVKKSIKAKGLNGSITRGELLEALPHLNPIWSMTLNGSDLLETLEKGVRGNGDPIEGPTSGGELLQVSGLHYTFDRSKDVGSRIIEAKALCGSCSIPTYKPIEAHMPYRIITTEFLKNGGDDHTVIRDKGYNKVVQDLNELDTVIWYLEKFSPVSPGEEERLLQAEEIEDENWIRLW